MVPFQGTCVLFRGEWIFQPTIWCHEKYQQAKSSLLCWNQMEISQEISPLVFSRGNLWEIDLNLHPRKFNSSPLNIGLLPKGNSSSNHHFSGANSLLNFGGCSPQFWMMKFSKKMSLMKTCDFGGLQIVFSQCASWDHMLKPPRKLMTYGEILEVKLAEVMKKKCHGKPQGGPL